MRGEGEGAVKKEMRRGFSLHISHSGYWKQADAVHHEYTALFL